MQEEVQGAKAANLAAGPEAGLHGSAVQGHLAHATLRSLLVVLERKGLLTAEDLVEVVSAGVAQLAPGAGAATGATEAGRDEG